MYAPSNPQHVSYSAMNLQGTDSYVTVKAVTVKDLLRMTKDRRIDLVKMDIKQEMVVLPQIVVLDPPPTAICVEFDDRKLRRVRSVLSVARSNGYVPVKTEGYNVLLVHESIRGA